MEKTVALTLHQAATLLCQGEAIMVKEFEGLPTGKNYFHAFCLADIEGREGMQNDELLDYLNSYYEKFELWK